MTARDNPLYDRDCNVCGCPLTFGLTADGKRIPLDLRAPVYALVFNEKREVVRTHLSYVTHYSTCPKVDEFKASQGIKP